MRRDRGLAVMMILMVCFAANIGGPGSPAAGGRNAVMIGILSDYDLAPTFGEWVKYGLPFVPVMALVPATPGDQDPIINVSADRGTEIAGIEFWSPRRIVDKGNNLIADGEVGIADAVDIADDGLDRLAGNIPARVVRKRILGTIALAISVMAILPVIP